MAGGFPSAPAPERPEFSARYLVREINMNEDGSLTDVHERRLGGDFLMDAGIRIRWKKAFQSVCLEVVETNPDAPAS